MDSPWPGATISNTFGNLVGRAGFLCPLARPVPTWRRGTSSRLSEQVGAAITVRAPSIPRHRTRATNWFDLTNNNYAFAYTQNPGSQLGGVFWPATTEYVAEVPLGSSGNASYNAVTMTGYAIDWNGNDHDDPGSPSGTDPYESNQQGDYNSAFWVNFSTNNAADPIIFEYNKYQ